MVGKSAWLEGNELGEAVAEVSEAGDVCAGESPIVQAEVLNPDCTSEPPGEPVRSSQP